jgi:hypothetical protein
MLIFTLYRWKLNEKKNNIMEVDGKQVLEFIAIKQGDTREWAIPGVYLS